MGKCINLDATGLEKVGLSEVSKQKKNSHRGHRVHRERNTKKGNTKKLFCFCSFSVFSVNFMAGFSKV
jgi:hypothetical protein